MKKIFVSCSLLLLICGCYPQHIELPVKRKVELTKNTNDMGDIDLDNKKIIELRTANNGHTIAVYDEAGTEMLIISLYKGKPPTVIRYIHQGHTIDMVNYGEQGEVVARHKISDHGELISSDPPEPTSAHGQPELVKP
jgi:hypothetical protein